MFCCLEMKPLYDECEILTLTGLISSEFIRSHETCSEIKWFFYMLLFCLPVIEVFTDWNKWTGNKSREK